MAGRPGFLGGFRQGDASDRDADAGFGSDGLAEGTPPIRLGDPDRPFENAGVGGPPGFDPVWGTLGSPDAQANDPWRANSQEADEEGMAFDVEIFGDGFQISGQIRTGQFDRLSDWLNMKSGFIAVQEGMHVHQGNAALSGREQKRGTLWVRLDQVVMVAERANIQQARPGAPVVQKQRRKVSIVTPGYILEGSLHVHAFGSMKEYLEPTEPHFLPITEVTVHWLSDPTLVARLPFAVINRREMITILDEPSAPAEDSARDSGQYPADDSMSLRRRFGAA
jgi:hypothetical protein